MRRKSFLIPIAIAALTASIAASATTGFGTVVPIGGVASDIVLDESRGLLYIANFGGNTIQVMSTANNAIQTSIPVAPQPGAIAMSPDSQYLVVLHYGQWTPSDPGRNLVTIIHLPDNTQQKFATFDAPLAVAFLANGQALIVTTTSFVLLDPVSGQLQLVVTLDSISQGLPVPQATIPSQILLAQITASADGKFVWGIGSAGSAAVVFRYDMRANQVSVIGGAATPALLPRVSVAADGSWALIGYAIFTAKFPSLSGVILAQYPDVVTSTKATGHAVDSKNGLIYAVFPDANQPSGPPYTPATTPASQLTNAGLPVLSIMDADNMTVRERLGVPEKIVGRALLSSNAKVLYAISDSGVMVVPVGSLNQYPRVAATQEDLFFQTSSCNRGILTQSLTITDPGGGSTDFTVSTSHAGVTISPSSGVTPATVQVRVDPTVFLPLPGTTAITLAITSKGAINLPNPVRLLVNVPSPGQRGTIVDVPGTLVDMLTDTARNRVYILRQDKNQLQVYDGGNFTLITTLRTATTPTRMAFTNDNKFLLVAHDNAQIVNMYDLEALKLVSAVGLPYGVYARSIAASNASTLAVARLASSGSVTGGSSAEIGGPCATIPPITGAGSGSTSASSGTGATCLSGPGVVARLDLVGYTASILPSLGIWQNLLPVDSALTPSPNGAQILLVESDGNIKLYSAQIDDFIASRHDLANISGAYAASSYNSYLVANSVLNASLVPVVTLDSSLGASSGFVFLDQGGFRSTAAVASDPGVIQNIPTLATLTNFKPTPIIEAPLLPGAGITFTRTVAPLANGSYVIALTTSGFTVLAWNYDAPVAPPMITSVVNAADGKAVAPGGLISIYGQQMSPVNLATKQIPLPTALGQSCVMVNGTPIPLLFVSSTQVNAQLPFNVGGNSTMSIITPGGVSNNYLFTVLPAAPAVFQTGSAGPESGLATIVRADDNQLVTPTNPLHPKDTVVIYLTGMGQTFPQIDAGLAAPSDPLASAVLVPKVTLGGVALNVSYAGLTPDSVGLYQINATVPVGVPQGLSIPLVIDQGGDGSTTTLNVRVVVP